MLITIKPFISHSHLILRFLNSPTSCPTPAAFLEAPLGHMMYAAPRNARFFLEVDTKRCFVREARCAVFGHRDFQRFFWGDQWGYNEEIEW
jgi:hypothetical protein